MLNIPNILVSTPEDFIEWSSELADEHLNSAPQLRTLISNSSINNKEYFSIKDDKTLIQYTLLCVAYGQIEPGTYQDQHYKSTITTKLSTILKKLNLDNQNITFITSIEDQITSTLDKAIGI